MSRKANASVLRGAVVLALVAVAGLSWLLVRLAVSARTGEPPIDPRHCRTPEELRKACAELLEPYPAYQPGSTGPPDMPEPSRLFIVDYLGSPDPALRSEALDILARAPKTIPSSVFTKYLSDQYPRDVRAVALARSLNLYPTEEEFKAQRPDDPSPREMMKPLWSKVFADLARQGEPPPHFFALADRLVDDSATEAIPAEAFPTIVRWCVGLLSQAGKESHILVILHGFPDKFVAPELVAWYPTARDREARLQVVTEYATTAVEFDRWPLFEALLNQAAQDKDPEIADTAKRALRSRK